jgi:glutaconate CoA-transferase subunit A
MVRIEDRTTTLAEAVAAIPDGTAVGLGGFLHHRHPMAAVRELARQRRRNLRLVAPIGGIDADMLIAAGAVDHITFGFVSLEAVGLAPAFMEASQAGRLGIGEHGDVTLVRSLQAKYMRVPWIPVRAWLGSDMEEHHPGWPQKLGEDGEEFWTATPVDLEVGLLHAPYATAEGDFLIWGEGFDRLIANAADQLLVTAEQIVSLPELREIADRVGNGCQVGGAATSWVVETPMGAHPGSCYPLYNGDLLHELEYFERVKNGDWDRYASDWLEEDEEGYVRRLGPAKLDDLANRMQLAIRLGRRTVEAGPEALC